MKNYISGGLKVFFTYCIALVIFAVFLFTVISLSGDKFGFWLLVYSFVMFLLLISMIYSDMKRLAIKEKRPQYDLNPYPVKGLVYGSIGIIPLALLEVIYVFLNFADPILDRIKHLALNTLLGPLYVFIKLGNESWVAYALVLLLVPAFAMLGYLAGFYGFNFRKTPVRTGKANEKPKK